MNNDLLCLFMACIQTKLEDRGWGGVRGIISHGFTMTTLRMFIMKHIDTWRLNSGHVRSWFNIKLFGYMLQRI